MTNKEFTELTLEQEVQAFVDTMRAAGRKVLVLAVAMDDVEVETRWAVSSDATGDDLEEFAAAVHAEAASIGKAVETQQ